MSGNVVLVRHGQADAHGRCYGARLDVGLTAAGLAQARAAAETVGEPALLLSSPARRARETAAAFARDWSVDERWAERDFGQWEGRSWRDCWAEAPPEILTDPVRYAAWTPPDGEPLAAVAQRVSEALVDAVRASDGVRPVVVVTHGGPIRMALRHALGLDDHQTFAFAPAPGSATWLRCDGGTWTVERFGA